MREYLFRGKHKDNGKWIEGDLTQDRDIGTAYISGWDYYTDDDGLQREQFGCEVISETVGEFTGLTDKNGVKIFEGDILKIAEVIFLVQWNKRTGSFCGVSEIDDVQTKHLGYVNLCEVIGNIHDNPELLKEASE